LRKHLFDLAWEYTEASGMMALRFAQWQPVNLPHDAMIAKPRAANDPSGTNGGFFPGSVATYRKTFFVPEAWRGQCVQLECEGVYMHAEVTVNSQLLRLQPYGYTSFVVDLTLSLVYGQENEVMVSANTTAQPNSRWYSGTGIYRHVWLRLGGNIHIQPWGVFVTTPVVNPLVSVVQVATDLASLSDCPEGVVLRSTILNAERTMVAQVETPLRDLSVQQTLPVEEAQLWSVDNPSLYTLQSEVLLDGMVMDTEQTVFGIRSISVDAHNGFLLNGIPLKLKGGCIHHDHGPLGAASYDRAEERKVEQLKSSGFNALRSAHNPPAPALLDACDRLGLLVINESFDCWRMGKNPHDYHMYFEEWWQRDTEAMVKRDRNHPSVIMWSIGNEILEGLGVPEGASWSRRQAEVVRNLDGTRLVTSGVLVEAMATGDFRTLFTPDPVPEDPEQDLWAKLTTRFAEPLDVVGYNYMPHRYAADALRFPGRVIAGTETWPHRAYDSWQETERLSHVIGDFVWTAWDYLGEAGIGKVTIDGRPSFGAYPYHLATCGDFDICGFKRPQSFYRDLLWGVRTAPFIGVLDPECFGKPLGFTPWGWEPVSENWTFPGAEGKPIQVDIYARDEEVELFINGVAVGRKPAGAASRNKATFDVIYQPGTIEAVGYCDGKEVSRTLLETVGAPIALRLTPDRSCSEESYVGTQRKAWQGRLLAIIRSNGHPGDVVLSAHAAALTAAEIRLDAK
jgi:beta-galactosidase